MKEKILTVYTGGTICTALGEQGRELSTDVAKRALLVSFANSDSEYASFCEELFEDSLLPENAQTLSENMTLPKLWRIIEHINSFDLSAYRGVILLHGTDTLAYSAAMLSLCFSCTPVPIMLVSGNRPPMDEKSNALANFRVAVELIMKGIAPNVYVPYRNFDGVTYVHMGSAIMQCANYTEDFFSAGGKGFSADDNALFDAFAGYSKERRSVKLPSLISEKVLLIMPYTGLDYSRISLDGVSAVIHGTYHSGTVCVERNACAESYSSRSVMFLAKECEKKGVNLVVAPSRLGDEQYSSVYDLAKSSGALLLDMTTECAYAKILLGVSLGLCGKELEKFLRSEINNEFNS